MVLNATFNNISAILWRSVLSVGKVLTIDDLDTRRTIELVLKPEALKSLYRSPGNKKKQLVLCKNYVLQW